MNYHKLVCLSIILLLSFRAVTAQDETNKKQEFSVYGKGILNSLSYNVLNNAKQNNSFGAGIGLEYALYFSTKWSISVGVEYQQYRSNAVFSDFNDNYQTTDAENTNFEFHSSADIYKEQQSINMINIPFLFRYETSTPWTNSFIYAAAGFQFGIPVNSRYKAFVHNLETSGYFQQWDVMLNEPEFMGFGNWGTVEHSKQELDIRNSYSSLLELGFKQELNKTQNLYFGLFANVGLNNLIKENSSPSALIKYNADNPTEFQFNPLFYSAPHSQGETYASKLKLRGIGIKIRYAFKF